MRIVLFIVFVSLALGLQATPESLSRGFGKHVQQVKAYYKEGETSDVFALLMRMKMAFDEKDSHEGLQVQAPRVSNKTCQHLLGEFVSMLKKERWSKNVTGLRVVMDQVASKCTSSDYQQKNLKGFDDQCALCVVILRVITNYVAYHKKGMVEFLNHEVCGWFGGLIKPTCEAFIHYAGPVIIQSYLDNIPADISCLKLGFCKDPKCRITSFPAYHQEQQVMAANYTIPSWKWLRSLFTDHFADEHLPPFDLDNDTFSSISTFRGYNWRGADCDEFNAKIYPGRKTGNKYFDHDCNGIYGVSNVNKKPYESLYCDGTKRLGVAIVGDSAGAHFSIPEKYFNASMITKGTYKDLLVRLADELDIPQQSAYTGFKNSTYVSHSVYKNLREWNLCNNNDYQNTGVNGGDSGNTLRNIRALKRDPQNDHPLLIFMELIGNDVCSKSFEGMTTVQNFKINILKLLNWLDGNVPAGSHLWIFGLADGDILYDNLYNVTHPLDITYQKMYNFLNCLKISPCWGWLNSNRTVRQYATQRARNLTKVYKEIMSQYTFKNFDIVYQDFPEMDIIDRRIIQGGDAISMIQPADGFHPNGLFHSYLADWIWQKIVVQHQDWIGPRNPHNQQILDRFHLKVGQSPRAQETIEIQE